MMVYLNGKLVPREEATVSVFDRCFRYGDGLFETLLVRNQKPFRWIQHLQRLAQSAEFLRISWRPDISALRQAAADLLRANDLQDATLRISISRGIGARGYAFTGQEEPLTVMTAEAHPSSPRQESYQVVMSRFRVAPAEGLFQHKTASRLLNVLATAEARDAGAQEALLLDTNGNILEGASSNVFWIQNGAISTPPVNYGLLPGITRALVLELCASLNISSRERTIAASKLSNCDGVFLTSSSRGVIEVTSIDTKALKRSPLTHQLAAAVQETIQRECA